MLSWIMGKDRTGTMLLISKIRILMRYSLPAKRRSSNTTKVYILFKNQLSTLQSMKEATICRMLTIPNFGIRFCPMTKLCQSQSSRRNSKRKRKKFARVRVNKPSSSKTLKSSLTTLWMPNSTTKSLLHRKSKLNLMKRLSEKCLKN